MTDHQGNIRAVTDGTGTVLRTNHYDPYGEEVLPVLTSASTLPASTAGTDAASRYMYGAKEWDGSVSLYDFSARWYNPMGAVSFTTMDPLCEKYFSISPYAYCKNNPTNRIDLSGKWDVTVHLYQNRAEYGYGIAVVTNNAGNEVFRFMVRAEGVKGRNRARRGADTPLGKYRIPNERPWINGGPRISYGLPSRLNMEGIEGEIIDTGRSAIRIHGGRQESFDEQNKCWVRNDHPTLGKTEGCLRAFDDDMERFKSITDELQDFDSEEHPGFVIIVDDLVRREGKSSNNYVETEVYYEINTPVTWQMIWDSYIKKGYYYAE